MSTDEQIGRTPRTRVVDRVSGIVLGIVLGVVVFAMLAPAVVIVVMSFSDGTTLAFPPSSWSLRHYETLFTEAKWGESIGLSLQLAAVTGILAVLISVPTALVLQRSRLGARIRSVVDSIGIVALVLPISAYAVALYAVFAQFGLLGSFGGLVIAGLVVSFPLTFIVVQSALSRLPRELELAAMTLGASRARAWTTVTLRLLLPAVLSGGLLAFITAFDEAVFVNFLGGPGLITLPKAILDSVAFEIDLVITAISTIIIVLTAGLMIGVNALRKGTE